jgi:hypothetical protein
MKLLYKLLILVVASGCLGIEAGAQTTLDSQAAASIDQGAVTIYNVGIGTSSSARRCVDATAYFGAFPGIDACNFGISQKWLLTATGQLAFQQYPTSCLEWPSSSGDDIAYDNCSAASNGNQTFVFQKSGNISNSSGALCLDGGTSATGTTLVASACSAVSNQFWTIQPDPLVYYRINIPADAANGGDLIVQNGSTSANALVTFGNAVKNPSLNSFWFLTPVSYASSSEGLYFIQNAQTGYCLTNESNDGGNTLISTPCNIVGSDLSQTFSLGNWNPQAQAYFTAQTGSISNAGQIAIGGGVTFYPATTLLNTILVTGTANPNDGNSLLPQGNSGAACLETNLVNSALLQVNGCTDMADVYSAAVDVLPDSSIRFRTTGSCLYYNDDATPGEAAQDNCAIPPAAASALEEWSFISADSFNPFHWPLYTALQLAPVDSSSAYLSQQSSTNQDGGMLVTPTPQSWVFNSANDVQACVDTATTLSEQSRQTGRAATAAVQQNLVNVIDALQSLNGYSNDFGLTNAVFNLQNTANRLSSMSGFTSNALSNINYKGNSPEATNVVTVVELARAAVAAWEVSATQLGYTPGPLTARQTIAANLATIEWLLNITPRCLVNTTEPWFATN